MKPLKLPPRSPNLNSFSERWGLSVISEAISGLIFFGEESLRWALKEYLTHYYQERNHQGKENRLLFPFNDINQGQWMGEIRCRSRLGEVLNFYHRLAA